MSCRQICLFLIFNGVLASRRRCLFQGTCSNFLHFFTGVSLYDEVGYATLGVGYMLPMLIETGISINHKGKLRLDLERQFQWTKTLYSDLDLSWRPSWGGERDTEFEISLMYRPTWSWAAGLMFTEKSIGLGAQVQF